MAKDLDKFYGRWFTYINQVFGDENIRHAVMDYYGIHGASKVIDGIDGLGQSWKHHIAIDLGTHDPVCSVKLRQQNVLTTDTACQSYSLYNMVQVNRPDVNLAPLVQVHRKKKKKRAIITDEASLKANIDNIANFMLTLLKIPAIATAINDHEFLYFGYNGTTRYPEGRVIKDVIKKMRTNLAEWKAYGYKYFLRTIAEDDQFGGAMVKLTEASLRLPPVAWAKLLAGPQYQQGMDVFTALCIAKRKGGPAQCSAITNDGRRCTRNTEPKRYVCWQHDRGL